MLWFCYPCRENTKTITKTVFEVVKTESWFAPSPRLDTSIWLGCHPSHIAHCRHIITWSHHLASQHRLRCWIHHHLPLPTSTTMVKKNKFDGLNLESRRSCNGTAAATTRKEKNASKVDVQLPLYSTVVEKNAWCNIYDTVYVVVVALYPPSETAKPRDAKMTLLPTDL